MMIITQQNDNTHMRAHTQYVSVCVVGGGGGGRERERVCICVCVYMCAFSFYSVIFFTLLHFYLLG